MAMTKEQLLEEALSLAPAEREAPADELLLSFSECERQEIDARAIDGNIERLLARRDQQANFGQLQFQARNLDCRAFARGVGRTASGSREDSGRARPDRRGTMRRAPGLPAPKVCSAKECSSRPLERWCYRTQPEARAPPIVFASRAAVYYAPRRVLEGIARAKAALAEPL